MRFLTSLFKEHCPTCHKELHTEPSNSAKSIVIKSCPEGHFKKEFHYALETVIETYKVS